MDYKQLHNKYYSRMIGEGILKAALCALAVGFAACGIVALITWFTEFNYGLWTSLGVLLGGTAIALPAFYFGLFKPSETDVARRLDRCGLDERVVTMRELQGDESYIASIQRADAVASVEAAAEKAAGNGDSLIRVKVATPIIIAVSIAAVIGVSMAVVTGLSDFGVIGKGQAVFRDVPSYKVTYRLPGESVDVDDATVRAQLAANNGADNDEEKKEIAAFITFGDRTQSVQEGGSTNEVLYTATHYYYFVKWVDEYGNVYTDGPSRHEIDVTEDMVMTIYFNRVDTPEDDGNHSRIRYGNDNFGGGSGGGDPLEQHDYIINGQTPYTEKFEEYYALAMKYLAEHPELSAEERAVIEAYFEFLKN